jgi:phosphodiesterase/alkaline phosphatase D-like protein
VDSGDGDWNERVASVLDADIPVDVKLTLIKGGNAYRFAAQAIVDYFVGRITTAEFHRQMDAYKTVWVKCKDFLAEYYAAQDRAKHPEPALANTKPAVCVSEH